ncbi:MAG: hypothetical protein ACQERN_07225 [Thermodesulfobacteriota bacterium]
MKQRKKKQKKQKHGEAIVLAWYTEEQWEMLRQVAADWDSMENTYAKWLGHNEDALRILQNSGYRVRIVDVDVVELVEWCKKQKRSIDGEARADFIEEKIEDRYGSNR